MRKHYIETLTNETINSILIDYMEAIIPYRDCHVEFEEAYESDRYGEHEYPVLLLTYNDDNCGGHSSFINLDESYEKIRQKKSFGLVLREIDALVKDFCSLVESWTYPVSKHTTKVGGYTKTFSLANC